MCLNVVIFSFYVSWSCVKFAVHQEDVRLQVTFELL